ncbi:MAG: hypothetical protein Q9171_001541 [Xanthocarpia ochracea]
MEVAANLVALVQAAHKLYEYGNDVIHARDEQKTILTSLQAIADVLHAIQDRETLARQNPNDQWYKGLLALSTSATPATAGKALIPDPTRKGDGALVRLKKAFAYLEIELKPKSGYAGFRQRWAWTHDKKKIMDLVAQLDQLKAHVDSVLQQDHFQLSIAIQTTGLDTNRRLQDLQQTDTTVRNDVESLKLTGADTVNRLQDLQLQGADQTSRVDSLINGSKTIRITTDDTHARLIRLEAAHELKEQRQERKAIIEWLSPLQFLRRQSDIFNGKVLLGDNFLESDEFKAWSEGRPWILYGYGMPGSGKTVLSSIVVDRLRKTLGPAGVPVLCMYLNYKERHQTLANLIGSLLKQLIQYEDDDFRSPQVKRLFREAAREASPLLQDLYEALKAEIMTFSRVVLVVDALDELPALEAELLDRLRNLTEAGLNIMITSRPRDEDTAILVKCNNCGKLPLKLYNRCEICDGGYFDLCQACVNKGIHCLDRAHQLVQPMDEVTIDIEPTDEEIKRYVEHELLKELNLGKAATRDPRFRPSTRGSTRLGRICQQMPELQMMIPQNIQVSCNGMFMLANLYMTAIKAKTSAEEVKAALENLPRGYDESYKATMERIDHATMSNPNDTTSSLAKRTLMWVACSYRSLSLAELQEALEIDLEKPDVRMLYPYDKQTLLDITAGLLYIDSDEKHVRLCHATAQEYFDKSQEIWFPDSPSRIARSCLQYLDRHEFSAPSEGLPEDEEIDKRRVEHPFLQYACSFWGNHASDAGQSEKVHRAITRYLGDAGKVDAFTQLASYLNSEGSENWDVRKGANGLHVAAWFGLTEVIRPLVQSGLDVNSQDPVGGQTPLIFACRRGHPSTVSLLLEQGATVNTRNCQKSTALFDAVIGNHAEVVAILLRKPELNVNEEHLHSAERTALMFAVRNEYFEIVGQLLEDPRTAINKKDLDGCTALTIAAKAGSLISIGYLLEHNAIDLNATDSNGNSALFHAANQNDGEIVRLLLSAGANPFIKDQDGGTALLRAIDRGNNAVVEIMLEYDSVDDSIRDDYGRTLLHGSATTGRADIAKMLITNRLDKDAQDNYGRTPLHEASRTGEAEVISLLLAVGANIAITDHWDRSARDVAWMNRQAEVILLLENKPANAASIQALLSNYPNIEDLPIWSLTNFDQIELLNAAIKDRPGSLFHLDPDTDNTALHTAVLANKPLFLKTLLSAGLSPDALNMQSRTPLHLAVSFNYIPCAQILLAHRPFPDVNIRDEFHQTPLLITQIKGFYDIAFALIEAGAYIDPEIIQVQALFFLAVEFGKGKAIERLIDAGAMVGAKNAAGKTAWRIAREVVGIEEDIGDVMRVLRANKSRMVGRRGGSESTVVGEEEEDEEDDNRKFQMSAFRRRDIFDEDDEDSKIVGIEEVEEAEEARASRRRKVRVREPIAA